ncbi:glycosyltransferase [uncultured Lutibacter sp.]|uniref:glycosyltransferase n=1 Tax=uncultured Lutibacter sp. TaxID=437739 RepID=UPI00262B2C45|nr:glycosyltransferase [uncultured Lutibacter sp.]
MKEESHKTKIAFVTTFPPTQCGIATFTKDLISAINNSFNKTLNCVICEIGAEAKKSSLVEFTLNPNIKEEYKLTAEEINNNSAIKIVHIQHEFGLFGGSYGNYLITFLEAINKPVTFTFHSVIPKPNNELKLLVNTLISKSNLVFIMTKQSQKILVKDYGISENLIIYIPHGTHIVDYQKSSEIKKQFNLENRTILSTFGLLSQGKSIETALKALPNIVANTPNVLYLIIGKTHPNSIKNNIDTYRNYLEGLVEKLHLKNHVLFIDKYLEINELLSYLKATDIYLFTSKDPNQAVSGTFSYAMSCACPIVATAIPHTKEVLTKDAGLLVDIENHEQFAEATKKILSNKDLRQSMAISAFQKTRESSWENVAIKHVNAYNKLLDEKRAIKYNYPPIKLDHLKKMTTELGIIQFCKISQPDSSSGYTLDDNARALIALGLHYKLFHIKEDLHLINTYLNFIIRCQKPSGTFVNYIDENNFEHIKNSYINLEDSNARAVWALGMIISLKDYLPEYIIEKATNCFIDGLPWVKNILSPRAIGFAIKGLYLYYSATKQPEVVYVIEKLANNLISNYDIIETKNWKWFENYLTYANSVLPEAMLYAYLVTKKLKYKRVAIDSFDFLLSKLFVNNQFKVISNKGWYYKGIEPKIYGEQPIDVSYTIQTLDLFYKTTKDVTYKKLQKKAFNWFLGMNHLNQTMYNPITGGCYDGLEKTHVNLNQGAESTICYLIARLIMENEAISIPKYTRNRRLRQQFKIENNI